MCLYALRDYREWSQRLAHPALLPWARRVCELLSENRLQMSRWLDAIPTRLDTPICGPHPTGEGDRSMLAFSRTVGRAEARTSICARKEAGQEPSSFSLWEKVRMRAR
jgi:hypothetical protein